MGLFDWWRRSKPLKRVPAQVERDADALEARGEFQKALALYEAFLRDNPQSLQALNNAATLQLRLDNPGKAAELLERAITVSPSYVKAWNNLGSARMGLRDLVGAEQAFETASRHDPQNTIARQGLAMARSKIKSLGMRTTEERGGIQQQDVCASCGKQYSENGRWNPENKAVGGALCRRCGNFYCEPCVRLILG